MQIKVFAYVILLCFVTSTMHAQIDVDKILVNYVCYKKPLPDVLLELSRNNEVNIAYSSKDLTGKLVSINAKNRTLRSVLEELLQSSGLVFELVDYNIVIYREDVYKKEQFSISGFVLDRISGERIPYADIYLYSRTKGTSSNDYGYYTLKLGRGELKLVCSYIGYEDFYKNLLLNKDIHLDIEMDHNQNTVFDEVIITADKAVGESIEFFRPEMINVKEIEKMVSLGGEDDLIRLLYGKAGVLTGADGFGGMHIRGGNEDQNQILLDGVPVYNANHAIGLYSVFNSNVIQSTKLMKGDFPARYGGSASSVLDIRTRNGSKSMHRGNFDLGLFTVNAGLEGPIVRDKISYIVSARRTYADAWIDAFRNYLNQKQGSTGGTSYYNFDVNAKIHARLNRKHDLYVNFFKGGDDYRYSMTQNNLIHGAEPVSREEIRNNKTAWANQILSLKWAGKPSESLYMDHTIYYSDFKLNTFVLDWVGEKDQNVLNNYRFSESLFRSGIRDIGLQSKFEYFLTSENSIRFGFNICNHLLSPVVYTLDSDRSSAINSSDALPAYDQLMSTVQAAESNAWENRVYVENEQEFNRHTKLNLGLNFANYKLADQQYFFLEPRLLLNAKLSDKVVYSLSATIMSQFIHLVNNNGIGFPSQVWLPSTGTLKPQRSWQIATGLHSHHTKRFSSFIQFYYKSMDNLIMANAGEYHDIGLGLDWDAKIPVGLGFSYGIESGISYSFKRMNIETNYGLLYSKRKFDKLNGGQLFEYRYSRRHNINLKLSMDLSESIDFSINWTYGTGNPFTFPTQIASFVEDGVVINKFVYEALNNYRIPDYHRLDFAFNFTNKFSWGLQKIALGTYNTYNKKNPFYITYDNELSNIQEISNTSFNYVYVFPLLPVLQYSIIF